MTKKIRAILVCLTLFVLIVSPLFLKVNVECRSQLGACPNDVNTKLQVLNGKYLFQAKRSASKILKTDFLISNFSMQLKLPNILQVSVIAKKPQFSILDKSKNKYLLIDNSGTILTISDNSSLPVLVKDTATETSGQKIVDTDIFALKLIEGINEMYQVRIGTIQNDTLVVDLPGAVRVILPLMDMDTQVLLGSLRLIYTKVTTDNPVNYSQIDMRFKNPIIR